jgi:hypothetical protein
MLTDVAVKALKPKEKPYKISDRDGMYVLVSTKGSCRSGWTTVSTVGARP